MGRELRRVPPNWEHPKMDHYGKQCLQPMYDRTYAEARKEWIDGLAAWEAGSDEAKRNPDCEYWEYYGAPPDKAYYRPWRDDEATWFQLWETVSEGTPVSPPFATRQELIDYLVEQGDYWQQNDAQHGRSWRGRTYERESAENVVNGGYAPSMIVHRSATGEVTIETPATMRKP